MTRPHVLTKKAPLTYTLVNRKSQVGEVLKKVKDFAGKV